MRRRPSFLSRFVEWRIRRNLPKAVFQGEEAMRASVVANRPSGLPPESLTSRYTVRETMQEGRRIFTIASPKRPPRMRLLYLHGGAYINEMVPPQWQMLERLLRKADVELTVPMMPLAPEQTCVEILAFVRATYERMLADNDAPPIAFIGDSAGGGLALALSMQLRDEGRPQPVKLVLISPWLDVRCADPDQPRLERLDPLLGLERLRTAGRWYAGALATDDWRVSPVLGDLRDLPPIFTLIGTHDLLLPDSRTFAVRMHALGAPVLMREYIDMLHVFPAIPVPEAREAIAEIVQFLGIA